MWRAFSRIRSNIFVYKSVDRRPPKIQESNMKILRFCTLPFLNTVFYMYCHSYSLLLVLSVVSNVFISNIFISISLWQASAAKMRGF